MRNRKPWSGTPVGGAMLLAALLAITSRTRAACTDCTFYGTGAGTGAATFNDNGFGYNVPHSGDTGGLNVGVGTKALSSNTSGNSNVAVEVGALYSNTSGAANTAIRYAALTQNQTSGGSTGVGSEALE